MKIKNLLPALFLLSVSFSARAQTKKITRLEIKEKKVFVVDSDNTLVVDTLIMHDKATINFSPETTGILKANFVIVGEKCTISSRGANGINSNSKTNGTAGQDGGDLDISLYLNQLGSLTIDTQGGRGGDGKKSRNGAKGADARTEQRSVKGQDGNYTIVTVFIPPQAGSDGSNASTGFAGGNGGNLKLTYSTNAFIPVFNNSKSKHSIIIKNSAGDYGRDGQPGKGGLGSMDGKLIQLNTTDPVDGQIKLVNGNGLSVQE